MELRHTSHNLTTVPILSKDSTLAKSANFLLKIFTFGDIGPLFSGAEEGGEGFPGSISLANYHSFLPVQSNQVKGPIIDRNEREVLC